MRFEQAIDIDAGGQRAWDVVADLERWPRTIDTVDELEILDPLPITVGTRVRLRQPSVPEAIWTVTEWQPPASFEWQSKASGVTSVATHRVEALGPDRSRLVLAFELRGLLIPIFGRFYAKLIREYLQREAAGMKRAAESAPS